MGGVAGVLLAVPPADFQLHNSLFLVAHFHTMIVSGVLFGYFAGITYWFPKVTGFRLNERLGKYAAICWIVGFIVAFGPLYILGLMGATRRLDHYDVSLGWQPLFIVAGIGVGIICLGIGLQLLQFAYSVWKRNENLDPTGDPWNGRTLEWSTASPAPEYNFAHIPLVTERDQFWAAKQTKVAASKQPYTALHVPKNTSAGIIIAAFAFLFGFGTVWHIWWLAAVSMLGIIVTAIVRLTQDDKTYERVISAAEVERIEASRRKYA
jgi:cytochrome o ubiquinol oxidase subunit 1